MSNPQDAQTDFGAAFFAGQLSQASRVVVAESGGRPFAVLDGGERGQVLTNLEGFLKAPVLRRGEVEFHDAVSFAAYVSRFKDDTSLVFADKLSRRFTAVLDYHEPGPDGAARWGRNRAVLPLRHTQSWSTWFAANKKAMNQTDFAQFLEDNIPDIASPAGADIVEIARTLEAKKAVTFESAIRANNGSYKFAYHEDVQGTARGGSLTIPDEFTLGLQPFEGSAKYKVPARFRYRIGQGGQLSLSFDLVRIEDVLEQAFSDTKEVIAQALPELPLFAGPAPKAVTAE